MKKLKIILFFLFILFFGYFAVQSLYPANKPRSYASLSPEKEAQNAVSTCSKSQEIEKYKGKRYCYIQYLYRTTLKTNEEHAFKTMSSIQSADREVGSCHLLAHGIGWAVFERDPAHWQESIGKINKACMYGALHGILERYSSTNKGQLDEKLITTICGIKQDDSCLHAIGHILLVQTGDNLQKAIELCSLFPTKDKKRQACLTGIYMEHMIAPNLAIHGIVTPERAQYWYKYLDSFEQLCRTQGDSLITSCWIELAHGAGVRYHWDPQNVFNYCDRAPIQEAANSCRRHAAGIIFSANDSNLKESKYMCRLGPSYDSEFEKDCYLRLVQSYLANSSPPNRSRIVDFCLALESQFKSSCFVEINNTLSKLSAKAAEINLICKNSKEYSSECLGKTNDNDGQQNQTNVIESID